MIIKDVVNLYGILKENENPYFTIKKAYNKYIFDKSWYDEIKRVKEEHYKQMAILLNFGEKVLSNIESIDTLKIQKPIASNDPLYGSKFVYEAIKNIDTLTQDTLDMLTNKYKMNNVRPAKSYILKL